MVEAKQKRKNYNSLEEYAIDIYGRRILNRINGGNHMKKLLSVALIAAVALSGMNIQAANQPKAQKSYPMVG